MRVILIMIIVVVLLIVLLIVIVIADVIMIILITKIIMIIIIMILVDEGQDVVGVGQAGLALRRNTYVYGKFSKFQNCFCGLDSGNLKFETVRTHKQRICF